MGIKVLNGWLNKMADRAEAVATLDKFIKPMRALPWMQAPAIDPTAPSGPTRNATCFEPMDFAKMMAACPERCDRELYRAICLKALEMRDGVHTSLATCWTYAGLFADGPKVYCPTLEEWEGLARVELRVPLSVYRQPFPTVVVSVPDGAFPVTVSDAIGRPAFVVVRNWHTDDGSNGLISGMVVGDVQEVYELDFRISWIDGGGQHIEDRLSDIREISERFPGFGDVNPLAEGEPEAVELVKRVVLNACLLLSQHAPRVLGKSNPDHAAKLSASLKKPKLPASVRAANERALKMMPTMFGFHQHIRVVERVQEPDTPEPSGSCPPKKPHWRRGHWRKQAHGAKLQERKLLFIPAKLVNEHLLGGPRSNTRVTMTTA